MQLGIEGLRDETHPRRLRSYDDDSVAAVIQHALRTKPDNSGPWSVRRMAGAEGNSKSTVQRRKRRANLGGQAFG